MRLEPGPEHRTLRKAVREFALSTVRKHAEEVDRDHRFPAEAVSEASRLQLMGMLVPTEYGGAGYDHLAFTICVEELASACASTAVIVDVHNSVATEPIVLFGSDDQKAEWLPRLARGELLGAFALTEPAAGSDAAGLQTTARRHGGEWVLNGRKVFITNLGRAGMYLVFARTGPGERAAGVSAFIVPAGAEGVRPGQVFEKMGLTGSPTGELILDDARVPYRNLLGDEGGGFRIAMRALDSGRIGISGQAMGIASAAVEEATEELRSPELPEHPEGPTGSSQGTQFVLADLATGVLAGRQMAYHAAALCSAGKPFTLEASMAKLFCTDAAMEISTVALQLAGFRGALKGSPFERHFRDAKALQIYEGSNQVQRLVIARHVMT
jgi:alkylation response protein AidB-like acyl-CoA dehydrogenase